MPLKLGQVPVTLRVSNDKAESTSRTFTYILPYSAYPLQVSWLLICLFKLLNLLSVFLLLITSLGLSRRPNCSSPSLWEKPLVSCSYLVLLDFSFHKGRLYFRSCASPTPNITWRTGKNSLEKPENLLTKLASVFFPVKCFHSNVLTPAWGWHWLRVCSKAVFECWPRPDPCSNHLFH